MKSGSWAALRWQAAVAQHLRAVAMRDAGMSYKQIGFELGVSAARAAKCVAAGPRLQNTAAAWQRRVPITFKTKRNSVGTACGAE